MGNMASGQAWCISVLPHLVVFPIFGGFILACCCISWMKSCCCGDDDIEEQKNTDENLLPPSYEEHRAGDNSVPRSEYMAMQRRLEQLEQEVNTLKRREE